MPVHLFVQYYVPKDVTRQRETDTCLRCNIDNRLIDTIHVFLEREDDRPRIPHHRKVKVSLLPKRITYGDWLAASNTLAPGDISILVNADMHLDDSVELLRKNAALLAERKHFLALSRYNHDGKHFALNSNAHWTQDTWVVVRGEEPFHRALLQEARFELGHPGCDNKIAYVMHSYGFTVSNPCLHIRTIHLHSDEGRPYDSRRDKLIGLHAFVHPAPKLGEPSRLDIELLSRAPTDITDITVNHWINGRKQFKLAGKSPNAAHVHEPPPALAADVLARAQFAGDAPELVSSIALDAQAQATGKDSAKAKSRAAETPTAHASKGTEVINPARPFVHQRRTEAQLHTLRLIKRFGHRFDVYETEHELVFADAGWPAVARLRKDELDADFDALPEAEQFALGFAHPVLDLYPTVITPFAKNKADLLFWQYPCRTEQDAWDQTVAQRAFTNKADERNIYVGLPWATFIDKKKDADVLLLLIASRLREVREVLSDFGIGLRVHTVCQHIHWKRQVANFKRIGITDAWISHKQKGADLENGVRLHAWSLYAVNYRDPARQHGLEIKPIDERRMLASFKGAHMKHYLSPVRLELRRLSGRPRMDVEVTGEWHFNKIVYDVQVGGKAVTDQTVDQQATVDYNRKLSNTVFSLCPVGAGPNTLRLWESLAVGAIPVVLSDTHELPSPDLFAPGSGLTWDDAIVFHPEADVAKLEMRLRSISLEQLQHMQRCGRLLYLMLESYSPVGVPTFNGAKPLRLLDLFAPVQLQMAGGKRKPAGKNNPTPAKQTFAVFDTEVGAIQFDAPTPLIGVYVALSSSTHATIKLYGQTPGQHKPVLLARAPAPAGRFQTIWFDSGLHGQLFTVLQWQAESDKPNTDLRILLSPIAAHPQQQSSPQKTTAPRAAPKTKAARRPTQPTTA